MGLFDSFTPQGSVVDEGHTFAHRTEWPDALKLEKEKEALGVYISAQPLDMYAAHRAALQTLSFEQAGKKPAETDRALLRIDKKP